MEILVVAIVLASLLCAYVAWKDLSKMEIPNSAVLATVGLYAVFGALLLPLESYLQGWLQGGVVLIVGFALFQLGLLGGGDAKFAAAMAMFVGTGDGFPFTLLLLVMMLASFATHRLLKHVPFIRKATGTWVSWESRAFPMGLPMGLTLAFYLCTAPFGGMIHGV